MSMISYNQRRKNVIVELQFTHRHICTFGKAFLPKALSWSIPKCSENWKEGKNGGNLISKIEHFLRITEWNHRIESQNCLGWKRPPNSSSPTIALTLPRSPLSHVPKHHKEPFDSQTDPKCYL